MDDAFKLKDLTKENCKMFSETITKFLLQKLYIDPIEGREDAPGSEERDNLLSLQMSVMNNLLTNTIVNILYNVDPSEFPVVIGDVLGQLQHSVLKNCTHLLRKQADGTHKDSSDKAEIMAVKEWDTKKEGEE